MRFAANKAVLTDAGARHLVNQDTVLLKAAVSKRYGQIFFAVVCDGLGGLSRGELASAFLARRMEDWFEHDLVRQLKHAADLKEDVRFCLRRVRLMWEDLFAGTNDELARMGGSRGIRMGTTVVAFLMIGSQYLVAHVGDSRLYLADESRLLCLTRDHSLIRRQLDAGILTPSEAAASDRKSVLLQCIGASCRVHPDFTDGTLCRNTSVLLCSDGFWRKQRDGELYEAIRCDRAGNEEEMRHTLERMTDYARKRGEHDNISVIWLRFAAEAPEETVPVPCAARLAVQC